MATKCPKCETDNPSDSKYCKECATPLPPVEKIPISHTETLQTPIKELTRGTTFAKRYEFIEELGTGGMGRVYKVFDKKIDEEVALKLLKPEISDDKSSIERFNHELKIARKITHKNVCRMHDINEEEGTHYITMEYVPGEDLKSFIKRVGQLPVGKALSITRQLCEGLKEAHSIEVVHRDLKPGNIMIDKEGNARIMDFGIARSLKAKGVTEAGIIIGTPEYMSPEQVDGKEADQQSDIYSLGIILYEMLTGRIPFEGDTSISIALKQKTEMPKNPREYNSQIPEDLSEVILRCMEKGKEKRYKNAEELLSELSRIEKSFPTTEKTVPQKKPKAERIERINWKNFILYGGAAVILILLFITGFYLITGRQKVIDTIAVLPIASTGADPEMEYISDGITESIINKLSQFSRLKKIIARSSVFRYKGKEIDPQIVGRELNVDAVLISQMSEHGDELTIDVELVNTNDNNRIWGNRFKRKSSEIFVIQEEISNSIAENLKLRLTWKEKKKLTKRYTESLEAYNLYLKGRHFWSKTTLESLNKGIEYFMQAIEKDPTYALPYVGIADCYIMLGIFYISPEKALPRARAAAEKALEMDETLAAAHASLGLVRLLYDWDWLGAERELKRAIEIDKNYAIAHLWYSVYLAVRGMHDESIVEALRAQELDPISPITTFIFGSVFFYARQYDRAIEECQNSLEINPNNFLAHLTISMSYIKKGAFNDALAQMKKAMDISEGSDQPQILRLIISYLLKGKINELEKVFDEVRKGTREEYVSPYTIAAIYLSMGQKDKAFEWLEKAYEEHDLWIVVLKVDPRFDNLRSDPRFNALIKKVGLE